MRLQAPADFAGSVTIEGGKEYTPDKNGIVTVENPTHQAVMRQHGFTTATGVLNAAQVRAGDPEESEDEFDDMTKAELIDWLEERDREDDIPAGKVKVDDLRDICRKAKADLASQ